MTPRPSLKLLILAGSLSFAASALQAQIVPGAQSNVTLTLTFSFTEENYPKASGSNTILSGRIVKLSYGNKQFIAGMNEAGDLPDNTVTGWKLVTVKSYSEGGGDDEDGEDSRSFYLVKAGQTPVPVPYLTLYGLPGATTSFTAIVNEVGKVISGKSTFRRQLGLYGYLPVNYDEFNMVGVMAVSDKWGPVTISKVPFESGLQVVGAKLGGIVGSVGDSAYPDENKALIEGSVSFSAEIPIDISSYPAPDENEALIEGSASFSSLISDDISIYAIPISE